MNLHARLPMRLLFFSIIMLFQFSCSKDSDLLSDYVLLDTLNSEVFGNIIQDDVYQVSLKGNVVLDVLANDNFVEEAEVAITETSSPSNGIIEINNDKTLTYIQNSSGDSDDSFTYTTEVSNPDGTVDTITGNVTVKDIDYGEVKAFPTAFGAGAYVTGGRGHQLVKVSNLNDSGPGSLREALSSGNRTIVFNVSGTIKLLSTLYCNGSNITIAGQTAPAGGITLTGRRVQFGGNPAPENIIIRYLSIRPEFRVAEQDAFSVAAGKNIIIDHVSISWGTDEVFSFEVSANNVTMQRMLIAESNKTGTLLGGSNDVGLNDNLSAHNNLWYNISHRFPNINTNGRADVINNIIYNWNYRLINAYGGMGLNHINNYYFRQKDGNYVKTLNKYNGAQRDKSPQIYTSGNLVLPGILTDSNADNWPIWSTFSTWSYGGIKYTLKNSQPVPIEFKTNLQHPLLGAPLPFQSAKAAFNDVTKDVGNNKRVDEKGNVVLNQHRLDVNWLNRVISDNPTYYKYNSMTDISSSQYYKNFMASVSSNPINSHSPGYDSDNDGMPDVWEISRGFDPNTADHNSDSNGNGYTNLEEYLNLVDF